ncbi:hypothetical protein [Flavobacterium sp. J27]|uniref:hypothetical protein n=1 Tax=Flavobacterium sp. J27 TaxID=2060419 RepID=UPI0013EEC91E|nr:hypothetical protein [Flavobacterium sp. J27]
MIQKILKLEGVTTLEKKQLKTIQGGRMKCKDEYGNCIKFGTMCAELECVYLID